MKNRASRTMSTPLDKREIESVPRRDERHEVPQEASEMAAPGTPAAKQDLRKAALTVAALAVLCGAAGLWYMHGRRPAAGDASDTGQRGATTGKATLRYISDVASSPDSAPRGNCETVPIEIITLPNRLRVTGTLTADAQSSVASNVTGIVGEVRVDRGSVVKKQDVLVQLDATDAQNRLAEGLALVDELKAKLTFGGVSEEFVADEQPAVKLALANLALAKSRRSRAESLAARNAVSVDECEQARAECECAVQRHRQSLQQAQQDYQAYLTAVARLAALRKAVADTTIVAPFDALVVEKHVSVGEQVTGGFVASKVITLARVNPLRVCVTVPQQNVGQVIQGQKLVFHVDTCPEKTFQAEVRYISPAVTSDTRSLLVEAVMDNQDGVLRPGLFVTAELELLEQQTEMWVPVAAVQRSGEVATAYVVRDGVARGQVVALGEERNGKIRIRSGLTGTESLLARPEMFHDGDKVN
jgi:membrane fusion protein, multidrug efflux system